MRFRYYFSKNYYPPTDVGTGSPVDEAGLLPSDAHALSEIPNRVFLVGLGKSSGL